MPVKYPEDFKRRAIRRYERGESIQSLCEELHVALSTFYQWRKVYCSIRTPNRTYTPAEFDAVCRRLQKLENEMAIIHHFKCIEKAPLREKLEFLEKLHSDHEAYSVHELCESLGVARGTFYNHIFRRADTSKRDAEQAQLVLQIRQVFDDNAQRFGAKKIRIILANSGVHVSTKRVSAIMNELELHSVGPEAKKQFKKRQQNQKKDMLERKFTAEHPNQTWVSDITNYKINASWVHLCIIPDLYSRRIVGYRISRNASTNLVIATLRAAYKDRGQPHDLTFHSDRGKQYTSAAFAELLKKFAIKQSFSATGQPHDNAVAESFFATFKKEEAYRREYASENSFRKSVDEYIHFYNYSRPHQKLKYLTPVAFEEKYARP